MKLRILPSLIVVTTIAALVWAWGSGDVIRQMRVMRSFAILILATGALLLWFLAASAASRRVRAAVALGSVLAFAASAALFRIRGVTGDLIPILEYRYAAARALPEPPKVASATPIDDSHAPIARAATAAPEPAETSAQSDSAPAIATAGPDTGIVPSTTSAGAPSGPSPSDNAPASAGETPPAADWPQFLGPGRNGVVSDPGLVTDWSSSPPKLLWRQPVGTGWAGFAISGGMAVTLEQRGAEERVVAYDSHTGRPLWSHADVGRHDTALGGEGPRTVPTISGGAVYAMGSMGQLNALDLKTGRLIWTRNIFQDHPDDGGSGLPEWGVSISPLILKGGPGERVSVIVGAGRGLAAYDAKTGDVLWARGENRFSYSSPVLLDVAGRPQIVLLGRRAISGHDVSTGDELWRGDWPASQPNVAPPLPVAKNRVLFSAGYGVGSKVFEIASAPDGSAWKASLVWSSPRLKSKFANMVLHNGLVYGLDDGVMTCIDPATGERRWKEGRFGHGQLILAGSSLLLQSEEGEIVLVDPSPEGLRVTTRFAALKGKTWNPPALAGRLLLVRNDVEAAAYELPAIAPARTAAW
jgi:outer membrane protein assembly factor BamB